MEQTIINNGTIRFLREADYVLDMLFIDIADSDCVEYWLRQYDEALAYAFCSF